MSEAMCDARSGGSAAVIELRAMAIYDMTNDHLALSVSVRDHDQEAGRFGDRYDVRLRDKDGLLPALQLLNEKIPHAWGAVRPEECHRFDGIWRARV